MSAASAKNALDLKKLSSRIKGRLSLRIVGYVVLIYVSVILVGHGFAWRRFSQTPRTVLTNGRQEPIGKITEMHEYGFGKYKDFYIRIEGNPRLLMIPGLLLNPSTFNAGAKPLYLEDEMEVGDTVHLSFTGGESPIVLHIIHTKKDGNKRTLMDFQISSYRFVEVLQSSARRGLMFIFLGLLLTPAALIGERFLRRSGLLEKMVAFAKAKAKALS